MIEHLISAFFGLIFGFVFYKFSLHQISKRTDDEDIIKSAQKSFVLPCWMLLSAALFILIFWRYSDIYLRIEYILYISIALDIAFVDFKIRKIPNELLLSMFLIRMIFILLAILQGAGVKEASSPSVLGFAVGLVLFLIPSFFSIPIGAGDIKYCAAIGFCLGIVGYLQAMLIMAFSMSIYLVYLMVTKKGNMKTAAAVGPYLSLGVIATLLFQVLADYIVL